MAFGGFVCSKNALTALNSLYIVVAVFLIGFGLYAKSSNEVTDLPLVAGIVAAGAFLLLVAILGLYGAAKHHQVALFFYMIILFLIFLVQFFVAVFCLAVTEQQLGKLIRNGWGKLENTTKVHVANHFQCCGEQEEVSCSEIKCDDCQSCFVVIPNSSLRILHLTGAVGLFFSFTEVIGIWVAMRFRNEKDPRANPHLFL